MAEARHLADQLSAFFRGPQPWIYPFADSIDDLTAAQAVVVPAPRMNSVFAVAYHVAFWHEVVLRRLRGLAGRVATLALDAALRQEPRPLRPRAPRRSPPPAGCPGARPKFGGVPP